MKCNEDNSYTQITTTCTKCSGTGRDWREDSELENYHKWADITLEQLIKKSSIKIDNNGKNYSFIYRDSFPSCSIQEEIAEIKAQLVGDDSTKPSQIFCTHEWKTKFPGRIQKCELCGKEQDIKDTKVSQNAEFSYDKTLHNQKYYFSNRCSACEEYSNTRSDNGNPLSGDDLVYCNIGGEVRADDGCFHFNPDSTAGCSDCWNFRREFDGVIENLYCDIRGNLTSRKHGYCTDHVEKERTEEKIPPAENSTEISQEWFSNDEYPRDPKVRGPILNLSLIHI